MLFLDLSEARVQAPKKELVPGSPLMLCGSFHIRLEDIITKNEQQTIHLFYFRDLRMVIISSVTVRRVGQYSSGNFSCASLITRVYVGDYQLQHKCQEL